MRAPQGVPDKDTKDRHAQALPIVLEQLDRRLTTNG
jgi:hypothetical protein